MADNIKINAGNTSGYISPSTGTMGVSDTAAFEDYFKVQYPEVWREQFYETDGIYKFTKKVAIKSQYLPIGFRLTRSSQQSYTLGDTWNMDGGDTSHNEDYFVPVGGNQRLGQRVTGRVTTRRFISIMHLSEDFIYKAQNSDIDFDLLNEMFDDHEIIQTHRQKSQLYLGEDGVIGKVTAIKLADTGTPYTALTTTAQQAADLSRVDSSGNQILTDDAGLIAGKGHPRSNVAGNTPYPVVALAVENDAYFLEGEELLLTGTTKTDVNAKVGSPAAAANVAVKVKVWQKDYTDLDKPVILFQILGAYAQADGKPVAFDSELKLTKGAYLARLQLAKDGALPVNSKTEIVAIKPEYQGLDDIIFTKNNVISGINREAYPVFNVSVTDLNNKILTAEALVKHLNSMRRRNSELVDTKVIAASPEALSAVETSFLQLYKYSHDPVQGGTVNIGFNEVKFYDHTLLKDDFAKHGKAYIVKEGSWAEAEYRPWSWITGGSDAVFGFMDRIPQTGLYEGFMVRDANGYVEEFNVHSGFTGLSESIVADRFSGLDNA